MAISSEAWRLLLAEGLLASFLRYKDLERLAGLCRENRRLHVDGWREAWRNCRGGPGDNNVVRMIQAAVRNGKVEKPLRSRIYAER